MSFENTFIHFWNMKPIKNIYLSVCIGTYDSKRMK